MSQEELGIFIEDEFDYAHFIPNHSKCYPLHGHTAKVKIELIGIQKDFDMIIDFGELKKMIKNTLSLYDHKLIASKRYMKEEYKDKVIISYDEFKIELPKKDLYLLNEEVTTENLAKDISKKLIQVLPEHIKMIKVEIYEGARKGAFGRSRR